MENFTQLDCGCYVGFDVYHEPMWGKKCPLHEAAPAMYEALKELSTIVLGVIEYHKNTPVILGMDSFTLQPARQALNCLYTEIQRVCHNRWGIHELRQTG